MILQSKTDNKLYHVTTFETYTEDIGLEYVTEDGSECEFPGIGINGGRTGYSSLAEILKYWKDPEK